MNYEWDKTKAQINLNKHRIDFADAVSVFEDEMARTIKDEDSDEERFIIVGMDAMGRILLIVFTWRGEDIRLISARKATARERQQYSE